LRGGSQAQARRLLRLLFVRNDTLSADADAESGRLPMNADVPARTSRDILSSPWLAGVVFCLPIAAIALSAEFNIANRWRAAVWALSLSVMAAGCLVNALRRGRMH
jgi:hypothetical protein